MSLTRAFIILAIFLSAGCGDNLFPSGDDRRPPVATGTTGPLPGQIAPDFSIPATDGSLVTLSSATGGARGAVFYFTMWCPICDSHMSHLRSNVAPNAPDIRYFLVDYVSGSVDGAASAAAESGYAGGIFTILSDGSNSILRLYGATMGTTIVIGADGIVRMNEDYRDGTRLVQTLSQLP